MKLNHEFIREILIFVEDNHKTNDFLHSSQVIPHFEQNYSLSEIVYHVQRLIDAEYLSGEYDEHTSVEGHEEFRRCICDCLGDDDHEFNWFEISGLTFNGHNYIDNARNTLVWKTMKEKLSRGVGSVSIEVMSELAKRVALSIVTSV